MIAQPLTCPAPGWLRPGVRAYAIGDVHGCDGRLAALHRQVTDDLRHHPAEHPLLVHLGDYIDRGPHSAAVVRRLAAGSVAGVPTVCLRGNHEQMLLDALAGGASHRDDWLRNGGAATLRSWGASLDQPALAWAAAMAPELPFLRALPLFHRVDGYVFVHAGLRPGLSMSLQMAVDMLWIREGFLDWDGPLLPESPGTVAVHGHPPARRPELRSNRIGIDTGAVAGGALTCAVLERDTVRFLTA